MAHNQRNFRNLPLDTHSFNEHINDFCVLDPVRRSQKWLLEPQESAGTLQCLEEGEGFLAFWSVVTRCGRSYSSPRQCPVISKQWKWIFFLAIFFYRSSGYYQNYDNYFVLFLVWWAQTMGLQRVRGRGATNTAHFECYIKFIKKKSISMG